MSKIFSSILGLPRHPDVIGIPRNDGMGKVDFKEQIVEVAEH